MKLISVFAAAMIAVSAISSSASGSEKSKQFNWMRDYIQLRLKAHREKVFGPLTTREQNKSGSERIVGGVVAPRSLHRYQAALVDPTISNDYDAQFCGGSLITTSYVLTAAHCIDFQDPYNVAVLVGTRNLNPYGIGSRVGVSEIYVHPYWNPDTFDYDVAVIKLTQPVYNIPLAKLPLRGSDPVPNTWAAVTGWGNTNPDNPKYPSSLRAVRVPVVNPNWCYNSYVSNGDDFTPRMFCAGSTGKDSCQGDSGGPISQAPKYKTLLGVVSWGTGCGDYQYPGVYTRLGHPEIYDFVISVLRTQ